MIRAEGLVPQGAFIFGDSAETLKTMNVTLKFYNDNQDLLRGGVSLGFIIPFQGSPIYKHCVKTGIIKDEVEFIENRAKNGYDFYHPMNITDTLSDKEFKKMMDKVFTAMTTSQYYSLPISSDDNGIVLECPYCKHRTTYKGFKYPKIYDFINIGCRHCNGRFIMVSKFYPLMHKVIKTIGFRNAYKIKHVIDFFVNIISKIKRLPE
jgi:DNA-directed RNA polymerase subunit RPC12/RpoP